MTSPRLNGTLPSQNSTPQTGYRNREGGITLTNHTQRNCPGPTWAKELAHGVSTDILRILRLNFHRIRIDRFTPSQSPIWNDDDREQLGNCPTCLKTFLAEIETRIQDMEICPSTGLLIEHVIKSHPTVGPTITEHIAGCNICRGLCELVENSR